MQTIIPDNATSIQLNESYIKDRNHLFFIKREKKYNQFEIEEIESQMRDSMDDCYDNEMHRRLQVSEDTGWSSYDSVDMWYMKQQWVERTKNLWKIDAKIDAMRNLEDITYLIVEWVDLETFEVIGNEYWKDKNTIYHKNLPCPKLKLYTHPFDNPIECKYFSSYYIEDYILQQISNPETLQVIWHYNCHSLLMKDENYIYLYFLDESTFREKIRKIYHFPIANTDVLEIYDDNSYDCYIKWNGIVYNYYQNDWCDYFSIVEWVDIETFNGYRDKFHRYEYWKINNTDYSKMEELSIEDIPF